MQGTLSDPKNHAGLVSCVAIIAIRNEAPYLPALLPGLLDQGIDVVILDNDSSDDSQSIIRSFSARDRIRVEPLPWNGSYNLAAVLRAKQRIIASLPHQWVISVDADEWLQSPVAGERLREGITRVDRQGFNAINFDEFVFLPIGRANNTGYDFRRDNLDYYFFESFPQRLMRAWRLDAGLNNEQSGGHKLAGSNLKLAPENFILRHYIGLSQQHIIEKYVSRDFVREHRERGWHGNRIGLTAKQLQLPRGHQLNRLNRLNKFSDKDFDRSAPLKKHYWEWGFKRFYKGIDSLKTRLKRAGTRQ